VRRKLIILLSIITITMTWLVSDNLFHGKNPTREKLLSQMIHTGLERWHFSGKKIDDSFSMMALTEFLEYLDYRKQFLLVEDVAELRKYDNKVDDQFAEGSTEMLETANKLLVQRIHQVMAFYPELLSKPFDFRKAESLEFDNEKLHYNSTMVEMKEYWRKYLKYRTLSRYIAFRNSERKKAGKDKQADLPLDATVDAKLEAKARAAVQKSFKGYFDRMLQAAKNDSLSRYFNSLVQVYDPHSTYYPPVDKDTFDMQMSGSFEGIGALLQQEEEYVKVASIVPGGPSWRQKQLQAGDLILKVAQGKEDPVDIIGMRVTDSVKLIRGKKGTLVRLTVKKPDERIMEIPIQRDVVILEETFAKSAILLHKTSGKRIGYIYLPGFYNDFHREGGRSSSEDVKKELEALKSKQVDGMVLDLRNNGGGALQDAVRMSGLFIPKGPIVQVKDKESNVKVLDDPDPGITYDGPLIVLVNTLSASASEILSAALQDYKRAVIVGGAHSYGKGTVQAMVNLDRFVSNRSTNKRRYGALTITIQKFYRIDGTSIQKKGVTPDIVLPDRHDSLDIGERHLDHSLDWDAIPAAKFDKWSTKSPTVQQLAANSEERVRGNESFRLVQEYIKKVKALKNDTLQSLKLEEVLKRRKRIKAESDKLLKADMKLTNFDVQPTRKLVLDKSERMNKITKERQENWFKSIKKDLILGETLEIMSNMLRM
jgi:carboxyl-terminal processing protease